MIVSSLCGQNNWYLTPPPTHPNSQGVELGGRLGSAGVLWNRRDRGQASSSRRAMSELRSGANRLRVETGRYEYIKLIPRKSNGFANRRRLKREERTCELCYAGMEDEMHFLWECAAYDRRRGRLMSDLEAKVEPWVLAALRMNNRSRTMTKIELADRYRALRHITQDKTVRLVTRYT